MYEKIIQKNEHKKRIAETIMINIVKKSTINHLKKNLIKLIIFNTNTRLFNF